MRPPERKDQQVLSATSDGEGPFSADDDDARTSKKLQAPFMVQSDDAVAFAYRPSTLVLALLMTSAVVLLAYHTENLTIPKRVKNNAGLITAVVGFLIVAILNFRNGPYRRPHPAFWRAVLGLDILYFMTLAYLLWQDDTAARELVQYLDPSIDKPAPERSYGQDCEFTLNNIYHGFFDLFALAHFVGWFGKAVILRDFWFCTVLSVMFEIVEMSLSHQIQNFQECWYDRWIFDVAVCNLGGTVLGLWTCHYLQVVPFSWRGFRKRRFGRMFEPLTPAEWTKFEWKTTKRFRNYLSIVILLSSFLLSELNVFYLKQILWLPSEHPLVIIRLAAMFLWALPATAEFYHYVTYSRRVKKMGSHLLMLLCTVVLESTIVLKWSTGKFPVPFPRSVKIFWACFAIALVAYPIWQFGLRKPEKSTDGRKSGRNTPLQRINERDDDDDDTATVIANGQRPYSSDRKHR